MNQMRLWLRAATPDERKALAELSGTTVGSLNQIAGSYRNKDQMPSVKAGFAGLIAKAAQALRKNNKALPELTRTDLSPDCRDCEYAKRCAGQNVIVSEFKIETD